jgi:hypothetical protein
MRAWPLLIVLPLLAGCKNETASLQLAGPDHALTLQVRQAYFWRKEADIDVIMTRQPDCLRRSRLDGITLAEISVEVLRPDAGEFAESILILKQGANFYAVSTQNCEMQRFKAPPSKPGTRLGTFRLEGEKLKFVAAPPATPSPAAPAQ